MTIYNDDDMTYVTKRQRKNAEEALNKMWASIPRENVLPGLVDWRKDINGVPTVKQDRPTCKTLACFGGWCAWWPSFRRQGVRQDSDGSPYMLHSRAPDPYDVARVLFGDEYLFDARRWREHGTDHEVVSRRLEDLIEHSKVEPRKHT